MMEAMVRKFLYYATRTPADEPPPPYVRGAREAWIDAAGGDRVHALYWPAAAGRPTILFFHGNAQTVFEWALIRDELAPLACGLLLLDYPGYGKSGGSPSEEALYDAGRAAWDWLAGAEKIPAQKIVIFGKSLGGGVAAEIALGRRPLGLILESTFTSIPAVLRNLIPFLPAGILPKSEVYDTAAKLPRIAAPVLVVHGARDSLIPVREGHALFAAANEPKRLYLVDGADHNDVAWTAGPAYGDTLRAWLDEIAES
jgi:pimeloyl-ACP methyl ester carboxylesterase